MSLNNIKKLEISFTLFGNEFKSLDIIHKLFKF